MKQLDLNLERATINLSDISNKLSHKKECNILVTRTRNKIINAVQNAYDLIKSGRLKSECTTKLILKNNINELHEFVEMAVQNNIMAFDLETTGLDTFVDLIVGVCLYTPNYPALYIPVNHTDTNNVRLPNQCEELEIKLIIKTLLESGIRVITHNGKFDGLFVRYNWGVNTDKINWYFDTMIGGFLLNENEVSHGLKYLYDRYIKKDTSSVEDFGSLFENIPFNYMPLRVAEIYGANDGYKTYKLYEFQSQYLNREQKKEDLKKLSHVLFDIEMPLIPVLISMEVRGVEIRTEFAKNLAVEFKNELKKVEDNLNLYINTYYLEKISQNKELQRLMGDKFSWNSPQQLAILFYDILEFPQVSKKSPRGTGEDIIKMLLEKCKDERQQDFLNNILRYRGIQKLLGTYIEKIPKAVCEKTNAVHTSFNQIGAKTGRFSSSHPVYRINLQNIPSHETRIRKMFKAREGHYLVSCDYSQIEPRAVASISKDENMLNSYINGEDLYSNMASRIFNVPVEECKEFRPDGTVNKEGKERRTQTKSVLLGILYERTPEDIAKEFGKPKKWGYEIVENFKKAFPKIETVRQYYIHMAETFGFISTIDGRKRRLPDMKLTNKDDYRYLEAHRQVFNAVIQGTSADIMKKAMVRLYNNETFKVIGGQILMTIHDELICEVPKEYIKQGIEIIQSTMKQVGEETLNIPMKTDVEVSEIWYGEPIEV